MRLRLPDYHLYPKEISAQLRRQLQFSGPLVTGLQVLVGAVFPIGEGILINLATGAEEGQATPYIVTLAIIGVIHVILFLLLLIIEKPMPQFLIQFDEQAQAIEKLQAKAFTYQLYAGTFIEALTATQFSINEIGTMRESENLETKQALERVLFYWIERRTGIFWFKEGDALHNFAVYLRTEDDTLGVAYRHYDDRIITSNRNWRPGDGHVGASFLQQKTLFWSIPEGTSIPDALRSSQYREEDRVYYNSMIATPIILKDQVIGVFVVTSSKPDQFEASLHQSIVEVISLLLAQAISFTIGGKHGR